MWGVRIVAAVAATVLFSVGGAILAPLSASAAVEPGKVITPSQIPYCGIIDTDAEIEQYRIGNLYNLVTAGIAYSSTDVFCKNANNNTTARIGIYPFIKLSTGSDTWSSPERRYAGWAPMAQVFYLSDATQLSVCQQNTSAGVTPIGSQLVQTSAWQGGFAWSSGATGLCTGTYGITMTQLGTRNITGIASANAYSFVVVPTGASSGNFGVLNLRTGPLGCTYDLSGSTIVSAGQCRFTAISFYGGVGAVPPDLAPPFDPFKDPIEVLPWAEGCDLDFLSGDSWGQWFVCMFVPVGFDTDGKLRTLFENSIFGIPGPIFQSLSTSPACGTATIGPLPMMNGQSISPTLNTCSFSSVVPAWIKTLITAFLCLALIFVIINQIRKGLDSD